MIRLSKTILLLILYTAVAAGNEASQLKYPLLVEAAPVESVVARDAAAEPAAEYPGDYAVAELPLQVPEELPAGLAEELPPALHEEPHEELYEEQYEELPAELADEWPVAEAEVPALPTAAEPELQASATDTVEAASAKPAHLIALIIDDLGNQRIAGERTVALHGPVACAIMPHTSHASYLAKRAYAAGKEVMLHLPMQPIQMERIAGPGEISLDTQKRELTRILDIDLESVPHTVGINNHMGSLITRHPGHMRWLMEELSRRGDLFFIDSYTTPSSVAYDMAVEKGVPAARRHVFLDNDATEEQVARQFQRLKRQAERQGYAIGIGHPYPVTLAFLEEVLPLLQEQGFQLVPVAAIIELQARQFSGAAEPAVSSAQRPQKSVF